MILFEYRNHKHEITLRRVIPRALQFLRNPGYCYQPGWFMLAFDLDKQEERLFALTHIILPEDAPSYYLEWKA